MGRGMFIMMAQELQTEFGGKQGHQGLKDSQWTGGGISGLEGPVG